MSDSPTDPMIGRLIDGRYQVRSRIARGGMATVYLATDLRLERRVAIKIMHGHLADDNAFKDRFVQEARSAARLAHPNVVNVFDQGQDADMAYLVMEYLPGITLRDLLKDYGRLTPEQTVDILAAVLSGLAAAHKAGIVHRDLKPENVLLADDGRIKIGDFGLARAADNNTATGQALLGTIAYLSPELVTRGVADARSDIYALGIMTFEMLTGEQPYVGEAPMQIAYQHANDTVPTPGSKVPGVPSELDDLVLWATARDPGERPRDARVMLDQLLAAPKLMQPDDDGAAMQATMVLPAGLGASADAQTQVLGVKTRSTAPEHRPDSSALLSAKTAKRKRRGFWLFMLIVLAAALAGGTGWYFGSGPGSQLSVPNLREASWQDASSRLEELGLDARRDTIYSNNIDEGLVAETDPAPGTRVAKGSVVTLKLSLGRQPITLPALAGLTKDAATELVTAQNASIGAVDEVFDASVAKGNVVSATRASDGTEISAGGDYFEGLTIDLVVSLGAIPDVSGKSVADATALLEAKGLLAVTGEESYSDKVKEGDVIAAVIPDGPVRANDTLTLSISRGPEPVVIPNVVGMPWTDAKKALESAGLKLEYNLFADAAPTLFTVAKVTPDAGASVPKGSTVKVNFSS